VSDHKRVSPAERLRELAAQPDPRPVGVVSTILGQRSDAGTLVKIPINQIVPAPQNRRHFDEGSLDDLAASIRATGLVEPIVVRPMVDDQGRAVENKYRLVAGERRWRAAQRAELTTIAAIVRLEEKTKGMQLAENRFREGLLPFDEAETIRETMTEESLSVEAFAQKYRYSTRAVYNLLALIDEHTGAPGFLRDASEAGILVADADDSTRRRRLVADRTTIIELHRYYKARLRALKERVGDRPIAPKQLEDAQTKTRNALEKILAEGWTTQQVKTFVSRFAAGARESGSVAPSAAASADAEASVPAAAVAAARAVKPLFEYDSKRGRLIIHEERLGSATPDDKPALDELVRELERLLGPARAATTKAAQPPNSAV
jgi:ParB/RepB/Spo0J family partition protein